MGGSLSLINWISFELTFAIIFFINSTKNNKTLLKLLNNGILYKKRIVSGCCLSICGLCKRPFINQHRDMRTKSWTLKKIKGEFPNVFRRGSHEGVCALHQVKVGAVDMVNDEL